jgi:hypothetical protein
MREAGIVPWPSLEDFGLPDDLGATMVSLGGECMSGTKLWVQIGLRDERASHDSNIELVLELADEHGEVLACEHTRVGVLRGGRGVALWVRLPADAPARYLQRLQIVRSDGSIREFEWQVTVPEQRVEGELWISRRAVTPGTTVEIVLRNTGPNELFCGEEYELQRFESRWIDVPVDDPEHDSDRAWTLAAYRLQPGATWRQEATIGNHVRPGRHRLLKTVDCDVVRDAKTSLTAEFDVLES